MSGERLTLTAKSLCILVLLMLTGCVRAISGIEAASGQEACASRSGVRWHWPDQSSGNFYVTCNDGARIEGKVKP